MKWIVMLCAGLWIFLIGLTYRDALNQFSRNVTSNVEELIQVSLSKPGTSDVVARKRNL